MMSVMAYTLMTRASFIAREIAMVFTGKRPVKRIILPDGAVSK